MKLQKREKVLLIILIFIAMTLLPYYFIIRPISTENATKEETLSAITMDYDNMFLVLQAKPGYEERLQTLESELSENKELLPARMKTYDLHYLIEQSCEKNGVSLSGLNIGEYLSIGEEDAAAYDTAPSPVIQKSVLTLSLSGSFDEFLAFVDHVSAYPYILLTELNMDQGTDTPRATIKLSVYAIVRPGEPDYATLIAQNDNAEEDTGSTGEDAIAE